MTEHDAIDAARARRPSFKGRRSTSRAASRAMRGNRRKDTKPELLLRKALWHRGFRYRLHTPNLPGKPDLTFPRRRVAVFVDGDFWHGRKWETRKAKLRAGSNSGYWVAKIQRNRERDAEQNYKLKQEGWTVLRLWETDILNNLEGAADTIANVLERKSSESACDRLKK